MLKYIKFQNFRSYFDETILSMEVKDEREKRNCATAHSSVLSESIYSSMMFIGFNGAGKSNLLNVLNYIKFLIMYQKSSISERNILLENDEYFRFFQNAADYPRLFEVGLIEQDTYYEYSFKILNGEILEEVLKCRERCDAESDRLQKIRLLFRREKNALIDGDDEFKALSRFYNMAPDMLFISNCASHTFKKDSCELGHRFVEWFKRFDSVNSYSRCRAEIKEPDLKKIAEFLKQTDNALAAIRLRETKLEVATEKEDEPTEIIRQLNKLGVDFPISIVKKKDGVYIVDIDFVYPVFKNAYSEDAPVDRFNESVSGPFVSDGQRNLTRLLPQILKALEVGGTLIVDELDRSLHHQFPRLLVSLFNDREINKNKAQLIFSSHESSLLDADLCKAQIKYIKKDKWGISHIVELQKDNKPIKSDLVRSKHYLSDSFDENINESVRMSIDVFRAKEQHGK